jgi:chemosensory pili system protein ChpC
MADKPTDFIPCILIPLKQHYLMLPNSTIAEIIPIPKLNPANSSATFWVGQYQWQDDSLAVIDLDSMIEQRPSACDEANKLCIIRSINTSNNHSSYAIPCYGAPQLIHLTESALKIVEDAEPSAFIHCQIRVGNKIAYIPNLDNIETEISAQK